MLEPNEGSKLVDVEQSISDTNLADAARQPVSQTMWAEDAPL